MDRRLRPRREKKVFSGFTTAEVEKMERILKESGGRSLNQEVFKKWTKNFNCSSGRAGKPVLKWTEVESWFLNRQQDLLPKDTSFAGPAELPVVPKMSETFETSKGVKALDLSKLEFEAKSSDDAWYDVEAFITHRILSSGEPEVFVRYVGFDSEEDEWVPVKNVRERSLPLEHSECEKVMVGDLVLCFQEKPDQARYYDARVISIQKKLHDIRGCRCIFLIRYVHDSSEESVRLKRLCRRPGH